MKKFLFQNIQKLDARLSGGRHPLRQYFILYTILFALACGIVFCWYFLTGRTFIWKYDGWSQHYKALVYYAQYMRSVIRELLYNHKLVFPEWDFAFGEGNDILQSLHYYVIGDPFALLSVLVPTRFLWAYYDFMCLLRLYLAGIAFSCLCFYTRKDSSRYGVMAGSMTYVFCFWAICNTARHPFFLNPLLYFPLIILGIEKLLRKEKPYVLIISVFLAATSNFYFFYVMVLLTIAYAAVRLIAKYKKDLKSMLKMLLQIAGASLLGTMMAGMILLPMAFTFLSDARMAIKDAWHLIYPIAYYIKLPMRFFTENTESDRYELLMGYSAPAVLAIFLLFVKKGKNGLLKAYFLLCTAIILIPALGQLFNGMSYMSNKWCFAFALLCAYIFAVMWPELMHLKSQEAVKLLICLGACCLSLLILGDSRTLEALFCVVIAFIFLFTIFSFISPDRFTENHLKKKQFAALMLVILGVASVSYFFNAATYNFAKNYSISVKNIEKELVPTDTAAVKAVAKQDEAYDFYRYSGYSLTENENILAGVSNTQYYWSISNPYISDYMYELEVLEPKTWPDYHMGYDDRTSLLTLSSVLYYVIPGNGSALPYGFTYVDEYTKSGWYKIYRNENALPLGYVYDKVISEETYASLNSCQKQEAMLQSVMLTGYTGKAQDGDISYTSRSLDYEIKLKGKGVTLEESAFMVTSEESKATISFQGLADSETYLVIHGLDFDNQNSLFEIEPTATNLTMKSSAGTVKELQYLTKDNTYYANRHDFAINLGYTEEAVTSITITFSETGVYSFDSIEVICQPMADYGEQVSALKEHTLENVQLGTDTVSGTICLDKTSVLCLSIPYSTGWTAYVDGEEAALYEANVKYMALMLDAGEHEVKLIYHTPYLRLGFFISLLGFAGFLAIIAVNRCGKRKAKDMSSEESRCK